MTTTIIVPIRRAAKDVIEVLLTHYAKAVDHVMLQSALYGEALLFGTDRPTAPTRARTSLKNIQRNKRI